ncbi:glycosyltransferase [Alphaproteobacteria bacterium]|nr:glycosyltransferase [Alphaproteobacteria bacterium]
MKKKIKVLHLIASLENGGAERQLIELLKENKNHGVVLFKNTSVYKNTLNELNIKYWELGVKSKLLVFLKILTVSKIIKEFQPNIVQAWMYNACFFSVVCKILNIYRIPLIWCIRCSDMTTKYYTISLKFLIIGCKFLSGKVDKIVYNSFSGMKHHTDLGYSSKNKIVILNGINAAKFKKSDTLRKSLRDKYKFKKNDIVIILVARVDPMKNHQGFLNAFKKAKDNNLDNLKLLLVGKETDSLNIPSDTIALGMRLNIEKYYNVADIIILPSLFGEGFSNVLVEGMLTNLVPVSSNVGDCKKIINNTGFMIEEINEVGLLKVLYKISNSDKSYLNQLGKKARLRAYKNFTPKIMTDSYYNLYCKVL